MTLINRFLVALLALLIASSLASFVSCGGITSPKYESKTDDQGRITYEKATLEGKKYEHYFEYDSEGRCISIRYVYPEGTGESNFEYSPDGKSIKETTTRSSADGLGLYVGLSKQICYIIDIVEFYMTFCSDAIKYDQESFGESTVLYDYINDWSEIIVEGSPDNFKPLFTCSFDITDSKGFRWTTNEYWMSSRMNSQKEDETSGYAAVAIAEPAGDAVFQSGPYATEISFPQKPDGQLFQMTVTHFDKTWYKETYSYDEKNRVISSRVDLSDGNWCLTQTAYDETENGLSVTTRYDDSTEKWGETLEKFDLSDNLIYEKCSYSDGSSWEEFDEYDSENRIVSYKAKSVDSSGIWTEGNCLYNEQGNVTHRTCKDSNGVWKEETNRYDSSGNRIYCKLSSSYGKCSEVEFTFDEAGRLIGEKHLLPEDGWVEVGFQNIDPGSDLYWVSYDFRVNDNRSVYTKSNDCIVNVYKRVHEDGSWEQLLISFDEIDHHVITRFVNSEEEWDREVLTYDEDGLKVIRCRRDTSLGEWEEWYWLSKDERVHTHSDKLPVIHKDYSVPTYYTWDQEFTGFSSSDE